MTTKPRKATTFRDHLFEKMKDREFFDAYMDEPCPKCAAAYEEGAKHQFAGDKEHYESRITQAVQLAYESCAKIADGFDTGIAITRLQHAVALDIAEKIRAKAAEIDGK